MERNELADRIADAFELGDRIGDLRFVARGQTNPLGVCRLGTRIGDFAVKRFTTEPTSIALAIESAAAAADVPMPTPVRTRDGRLALRFDEELWVRVYEWVDGSACDWGETDPDVAHALGLALARIHALQVPTLDETPWSAPTADGWNVLTELADRKRAPWAEQLRLALPALEQRCRWLSSLSPPTEPYAPSQRDLHPPNVVKGTDARFYIVDWDAAGPARPTEDLAKWALVWSTPEDGHLHLKSAIAFIRGYREAGGTFAPRGTSDFRQDIKDGLWWLEFNVRRDLGDRPGADPELVPALLSHFGRFDLDVLERRAGFIANAARES